MAKTLIDASAGGVVYGTGDYYTRILQDLFLPVVADTVIYPNTRLKRLPRNSTRVQGKNVVFPVHTDDANGVVAIGAGGTLPEPDVEKFNQYSFGIRHIYGRMKFDGITSDANDSAIASWLDIVMNEMQAKAKLLARQRQRMYSNDGSGILCRVISITGPAVSETITVGIQTQIIGNATITDSVPTRFIKVGQLLASINTSGVKTGAYVVTSKTNTTIVATKLAPASGTVGAAATDVLVSLNTRVTDLADFTVAADTGYKNEPMGIRGIIGDHNPLHDTNFQGIDAAAAGNDWHRATILSNSGVARPITVDLLDEAVMTVVEKADSVPTAIFGDFKQVRKVAALILPDRRFNTTGTPIDFELGYGDLTIHGIPFFADRDCYGNSLEFIDETDLKLYVMKEMTWMDKDGSIYQRILDKDEYQATFYCRETMGCDVRDKHLLITDLA